MLALRERLRSSALRLCLLCTVIAVACFVAVGLADSVGYCFKSSPRWGATGGLHASTLHLGRSPVHVFQAPLQRFVLVWPTADIVVARGHRRINVLPPLYRCTSAVGLVREVTLLNSAAAAGGCAHLQALLSWAMKPLLRA